MNLSINAQLLKYFAQQYPGIPRKRLVKMVFMSDIISRQYLGRPTSTIDWILYHYGPYGQAIPDAITELEEAELCWTDVKKVPDEPRWKKLHDYGKPTVFEFSLAQDEILGFVVETYLDMPMEELLDDVVYEVTPVKQAERIGQRLDMNLADNEGKREVGFDLEKIIHAERQAEEGNFLTAREYFDGLRDHLAGRHTERN